MAPSLKPASKQDFGNSLDLVDIEEIKGNTVIIKDGSLRQVDHGRRRQFCPQIG